MENITTPNNSHLDLDDFHPRNHLMSIKGKYYLPVQWRIIWFRKYCPLGTIRTKIIEHDREKGYVLIQSTIDDGKGAVATAMKSCTRSSFPDYVEKAEAGCIGRALQYLGYGTQFAGYELDEGEYIVDSGIPAPDKENEAQNTVVPSATASVSRPKNTAQPKQKALPDPKVITPEMIKKIESAVSIYGSTSYNALKDRMGLKEKGKEDMTIQEGLKLVETFRLAHFYHKIGVAYDPMWQYLRTELAADSVLDLYSTPNESNRRRQYFLYIMDQKEKDPNAFEKLPKETKDTFLEMQTKIAKPDLKPKAS